MTMHTNAVVSILQESQVDQPTTAFASEERSGSAGDEFGSSSGSNQSGSKSSNQQNQCSARNPPVNNHGHKKDQNSRGDGRNVAEKSNVDSELNGAVVDEKTNTGSDLHDQKKVKSAPIKPQDGSLKKPDAPMSCPRCSSLDTKFCYYNNYNVNQPRHFCKNCQRYWTAGGTLRNVPVGSGRRKNKSSSSIRTPGSEQETSADQIHSSRGNSSGVTDMDMDSTGAAAPSQFMTPESQSNFHHAAIQSTHPAPYMNQQMIDANMAPPWAGGAPPHPWAPSAFPPPPPPYGYFAGGAWAYGYVQPPTSWSGVAPWTGNPQGGGTQWGGPWGWAPTAPVANQPTGAVTLGKRPSREEGHGMAGAMVVGDPEAAWVPKTLRVEEGSSGASAWTRVGASYGGPSAGVVRPFPTKEVPASVEVLHANPAAMARSMAFNES